MNLTRLAKLLDVTVREEVHAALTSLFAQGGAFNQTPLTLKEFFTELKLAEIAKNQLDSSEVFNQGRAVIVTAGPPGAGKSSVLAELSLDGYRLIDPDVIKDVLLDEADERGLLNYRLKHPLPDQQGHVLQRELSSHVHHFSTTVANWMRETALRRGENIIIDGSLAWEPLAQQYVRELVDAGYESATVISVDADEELVVERARARWWAGRKKGEPGGRFVPEDIVRASYSGGKSACSRNAAELAERAQDALGEGKLLQYRFDPETGTTRHVSG